MTTAFTTIAHGEGSRIVEPRRSVVRDYASWAQLWAVHAGADAPVPSVNFGTQMIAAVFAGTKPSAGYGVDITGSRREGAAIVLIVEERTPAAGKVAAAVTATPFHIVAMPRYDGDVRFSSQSAARRGEARPWQSRPGEHAPSSTGLSPSVAGALAYLAGPFSGVTILLAEKSSRFVRFHAWQAIVGLGGLGLLAIGLLASAFLALFVSSTAFTVLYRMSAVAGAGWVVVWIVCVASALGGRMWKLPLAGDYAKRRASIKP